MNSTVKGNSILLLGESRYIFFAFHCIKKYSHIFLDASSYLEGDMYDSFHNGMAGVTRTLYEYFDWKKYPIIILTLYLFFCIILPPFFSIYLALALRPLFMQFALASLLFYFAWSITCYNRRLKWFTPLFIPVQFQGDEGHYTDQNKADEDRSRVFHDCVKHTITPSGSVWWPPGTF